MYGPEPSGTWDGSVLNELVTTVIHELIHNSGHVQGIAILNSGAGIFSDFDAAAKSLTSQLMAAVLANNVDLNRDRDDCGAE